MDIDEKLIIDLYKSGIGSPTIAKKINSDFYHVLKILKKFNIPLRSARESALKYSFNENFFENIDSEEKAYWLGFIFADGSLDEKRHKLKISISIKDKEILEKFKKSISSNHKINNYKISSGYSNNSIVCEISICSQKLCNDLYNSNIIPNKTFSGIPPILSNNLEPHFWRGMLDGDGWVSISERNNKYLTLETGICGNIYAMQSYSKFLTKNNITNKITSDKSIFRTRICANRALNLLNILYGNATIFLQRKYNNYIKYKNFIEDRNKLKNKNPGISRAKNGNYQASSRKAICGIQKHLGTFETIEKAIKAQRDFHNSFI